MKKCLSEKTLLLLHSEGGSESDRAHLGECLNCARRYRQLANELGEIVAALKGPAPRLARRRQFSHSMLGWSIAAAAIVLAFLGGRFTNFVVAKQNPIGIEHPWDPDLAGSDELSLESLLANDTEAATAASYGLYIDALVARDQYDHDFILAAADEEADSNGF